MGCELYANKAIFIFKLFFKISFIYLRKKGEADSLLSREPDMWLDPMTLTEIMT